VNPDYSAILNDLVNVVGQSNQKDWWDIATVLLTAFSLIMIGVTTVLTRRMQTASQTQAQAALEAVRESVEQRQVAERTLEEARKQTLLSVRPLVILETGSMPIPTDDHPTTLMYRNIGRGPAFAVSCVPIKQTYAEINCVITNLIETDKRVKPEMHVLRRSYQSAGEETAFEEVPESLNTIINLMQCNQLPNPLMFHLTYRDMLGNAYDTRMQLTAPDWIITKIHRLEYI